MRTANTPSENALSRSGALRLCSKTSSVFFIATAVLLPATHWMIGAELRMIGGEVRLVYCVEEPGCPGSVERRVEPHHVCDLRPDFSKLTSLERAASRSVKVRDDKINVAKR